MGIMKASSPAHTPHLTPNLSSLPHTREQTATFQQCLVIQKLPQRRNAIGCLRLLPLLAPLREIKIVTGDNTSFSEHRTVA